MHVALSCGVPCARDVVLEPSDSHAEAERSFEREIQNMCICGIHPIKAACWRVQGLHAMVVRGDVRRQAAALAASRLHRFPHEGGFTFLFILLSKSMSVHAACDCACLRSVLSWGTCPTVFFVPASLDGKDARWTAFGFATQWVYQDGRERKWQQDLLAYGSAPWRVSCVQPRGDGLPGLCVMSMGRNEPRNLLYVLWQAQWWRWHARRVRRLWVATWA